MPCSFSFSLSAVDDCTHRLCGHWSILPNLFLSVWSGLPLALKYRKLLRGNPQMINPLSFCTTCNDSQARKNNYERKRVSSLPPCPKIWWTIIYLHQYNIYY